MAKHNATGRSKGSGKYVQVHEYIMRCYAWNRLSPLARCAWLEINLLYNGKNNGLIGVSARLPGDRLAVGKSSAARAIDELLKWRFLECVRASSFSQKKTAAEYRLTHLPCDLTKSHPSKPFMRIGEQNIVALPEAAE